MKILSLILSIFTSLSIVALPVDGNVFYKKSDGEIVDRAVTLDVPAMGQGEVMLFADSFEWRSTDFWTTKQNGQILFTVVFKTEFMNKKSSVALQGTYLKGENKIIYYGSVFKKEGHSYTKEDITDFRYSGGFNFTYK